MSAREFSFPSSNVLRTREDISSLFDHPDFRIKQYPLMLLGKKAEDGVKFMFSVSKRRFPKAHDRNRIKRLQREALRLMLPSLRKEVSIDQFHLALVYIGDKELKFEIINKALHGIVKKLGQ
jgi:ribonuclease P protein component